MDFSIAMVFFDPFKEASNTNYIIVTHHITYCMNPCNNGAEKHFNKKTSIKAFWYEAEAATVLVLVVLKY